MKKIIQINLAFILFILTVSSGSAFAQFKEQMECKQILNLVDKGKISDVINLINETNVNCSVSNDGTPLINAVRTGNLEMVAVLMLFNADVNQGLAADGNPLIQASRKGNVEIAAFLIQNGADVNAFVPEDETPLINAVAKGHLDVIKLLLENGADINKAVWSNTPKGRELRSPLSMAKKKKRKKIVNYLVKYGATS